MSGSPPDPMSWPHGRPRPSPMPPIAPSSDPPAPTGATARRRNPAPSGTQSAPPSPLSLGGPAADAAGTLTCIAPIPMPAAAIPAESDPPPIGRDGACPLPATRPDDAARPAGDALGRLLGAAPGHPEDDGVGACRRGCACGRRAGRRAELVRHHGGGGQAGKRRQPRGGSRLRPRLSQPRESRQHAGGLPFGGARLVRLVRPARGPSPARLQPATSPPSSPPDATAVRPATH